MLLNCGVGEDLDLRVPWTARRSNQSILKEISPEHLLEGLMLKLKLQYFGHLMRRTDSLEKTFMLGKTDSVQSVQSLSRVWLCNLMNCSMPGFPIHQHELAIGIHMSLPSSTSLPSLTLSHPSRVLQRLSLSSLSHRANFHWPSILHMVAYKLPCYFLHLCCPLLPHPPPMSLYLFSMSANRFITTIFLGFIYMH